ncbi:MAG: DNA translocase FtsK 4TM domain-containing protein, partial [Anaerolineae bacterium]
MARKKSRKKRSWPRLKIDLEQPLQREIAGLLLAALGGVTLLGLLSITRGTLSDSWSLLLRQVLGWGAYPVAIVLGGGGLLLLLHKPRGFKEPPWRQIVAAEVIFLVILAMIHLLSRSPAPLLLAQKGGGGGYIGWAISHALVTLVGSIGAFFLLLLSGTVSLILGFQIPLQELWEAIVRQGIGLRSTLEQNLLPRLWRAALPPALTRPDSPPSASRPRRAVPVQPQPVPTPAVTPEGEKPRRRLRRRRGPLPSLDLLNKSSIQDISRAELEHRAEIIEETLASFGLPVEVVDIQQGPTITQFGLKPGYIEKRMSDGRVRRRKVKVSKINALANDLALALAAS